MALHEDLKAFFIAIMSAIRDGITSATSSMKYASHIMIALSILILSGGLFMGYRHYITQREQSAQRALAEYVQDYYLALQSNNADEWQRVSALFEHGYNRFSNSYLAPYFLVFQSEVYVRQGNTAQAIETLEKAVCMAPHSPLIPLLNTKLALMQLDSGDVNVQDKGLQLLSTLAHDKNNRFSDVALFYVGRYYWDNNKMEDAQKVWQELADSAIAEKSSPSPWVYEAKSRLKQFAS